MSHDHSSLSTPQFDAALAAPGVLIADFWAPWCGPCRTLAPQLDKATAQLGAAARVVKVDIDANPELATRYDVRSIPCLVYFKDGVEVHREVGVRSADAIRKVAEHVAHDHR